MRFLHAAQLTLKPLFFEVPLLEIDPIFTGRLWLLQEFEAVVQGSSSGILISGSPGTGKTALILQLVEYSCFGRRKDQKESQKVENEEKIEISPHPSIKSTNDRVSLITFLFI